MPALTDTQKQIGEHWNPARATRRRPHHLPVIRQYWSQLICGEPLDKMPEEAVIAAVRKRHPNRVFKHGVSIGCGTAAKETRILQRGLVERYTCYELSESRVAKGKALAEERGVADRIEFVIGDAFETAPTAEFDFVSWMESLHHMFDVPGALRWSKNALTDDGLLVVFEYAGPNKLQFNDEMLRIANGLRAMLPDAYFANCERTVSNPSLDWFEKYDPSEAVDSEAILPTLNAVFPQADVTSLGGLVVHAALKNAFGELIAHDSDDWALTKQMMQAEDYYRDIFPIKIFAIADASSPR